MLKVLSRLKFPIATFSYRYSTVFCGQMTEVTNRKWVSTGIYKTIEFSNLIFYITRTLKLIMFSKPKSSRCKYLFQTISITLELKKLA